MADTSLTSPENQPPRMSDSSRRTMLTTLVGGAVVTLCFMAMAVFVWQDSTTWKEAATDFLAQARGEPWALGLVCLAYIVSGMVMFPITLLNLIVAIVFGLWGIFYGLIGVMVNTVLFFWLGHLARKTRRGKILLSHPNVIPVDHKLHQSGLAGMVAIHALPFPPFTILNFIAGLSSITATAYILGTFLAMLPGAIARGVVGESLSQILLNPTAESYMYLAGGIILWVALIAVGHYLLKYFQSKEKTAS